MSSACDLEYSGFISVFGKMRDWVLFLPTLKVLLLCVSKQFKLNKEITLKN